MSATTIMDYIRACAAIEAGPVGPEEIAVLRRHRRAIAEMIAAERTAGTGPNFDRAILRCKVEEEPHADR